MFPSKLFLYHSGFVSQHDRAPMCHRPPGHRYSNEVPTIYVLHLVTLFCAEIVRQPINSSPPAVIHLSLPQGGTMLAMLMRRLMGNRAVPSVSDHLSDVLPDAWMPGADGLPGNKTTKKHGHKIVILSLVNAKNRTPEFLA